jgi:hypothetical protein
MTKFEHLLQSLDLSTIRLLPGRVIIAQDPLPDKEGSLYLPQRTDQPDHPANTGTILAIGHGPFKYIDESTGTKKSSTHPGLTTEDAKAGDRVIYRLLMSDLNQGRVFADIRRIDAVIE